MFFGIDADSTCDNRIWYRFYSMSAVMVVIFFIIVPAVLCLVGVFMGVVLAIPLALLFIYYINKKKEYNS